MVSILQFFSQEGVEKSKDIHTKNVAGCMKLSVYIKMDREHIIIKRCVFLWSKFLLSSEGNCGLHI